MAIDIIARGLATSLIDSNGKILSDKMPVFTDVDTASFTPVGNLTDASQIEGKTAEEVLLTILFGIVNPTLSDPSVKAAFSADMNQPIIGRETTLKGTITFDRGKIDPAFGTSGYRVGAPSKFVINGIEIETSNTSYDFEIVQTPTLREMVIPYSVFFTAGEQPMNSIGQPIGEPYSAGSLSGELKLNAVYPLYAEDGVEHEFTWLQEDDGNCYFVAFAGETDDYRQNFAVSSEMQIIGIQAFNLMSQKWEWLGSQTAAISLTYFNIETISINNENYILYTYNSTPVGARELKIFVK